MSGSMVRVFHPLTGAISPPWRTTFQVLYRADVPNHEVIEHPHRDHELLVIQRGCWRGTIDGQPVVARAPSLLVVRPGQHHADDCRDPLRFLAVVLRTLPGPPDGSSAPVLKPGSSPVMALSQERLREFEALADAMSAASAAGDAASAPVLDALATAFLWTWAARVPLADLVPDVASYIEVSGFAVRLHAVFTRHERGHLGLAALARAMGMSERTLSWRCHRHFATSPARLFQRHRMRAAWELLRNSTRSVAEIADRFGYASPAHFSTAFRRCFGMPPREARRV